ncbi:unnamed protein product [Linum trigynum]|uniref:Uncharacterized protein n=1 Tax=Linum trigynum TaxID=586398 RepID=A0AAV2FSR2_9ROSI
MTSRIKRSLRFGGIYVIKSFGLTNPPNLYRACSFDLALCVTPVTSFQECLYLRAGEHRFLTDVVGRLHSISGISHKDTKHGPTVKQTVVLEDESGKTATITLWDDFSGILDHVALTHADAIEAVVLAFGGLLVNRLGGECALLSYSDPMLFVLLGLITYCVCPLSYVLSSSAATRAAVNPPVPMAYHLASRFADVRKFVGSLPVEFAMAGDAAADGDRPTNNLHQLLLCSRDALRRRDNTFCCSEDWQLQEDQMCVCYKIQLTLRDATSEARFILMGGCGHALVNVSAGYLA